MWLKKINDQLDVLSKEIANLSSQLRNYESKCWVPPGHFYSPIVEPADIKKRRETIFDPDKSVIEVDLNGDFQKELAVKLSGYYEQLGYTYDQVPERRYYFNNGYFSHMDGVVLACMILHYKPKRIIESGSGFTSAVMADVNELYFDNKIDLTFIDPHPERVYQLLRETDIQRYSILKSPIQEIDLQMIEALEPGDFFVADTTHVTKCDSDVNHIVFEILPRLKPGVFVHFHDVFYPFEYPEEWVSEIRRSWNEIYLLRAFLAWNPCYKIIFFNSYMAHSHSDVLKSSFSSFHALCEGKPLSLSGGSLWLQRVQ
jgi:hypothetical protein